MSGLPWLRGVGWLDRGTPFETGAVAEDFVVRLRSLLQAAFQPVIFPGVHTCDVCQYNGAIGSSNLFVPGDGVLFVCPELIVHYISAHWYRPPDVFIESVMRCPDMGTPEYRRAFLAAGGRGWLRAMKGNTGPSNR
ncbi:MAG: hypothetical protein AB7S36_21115 [Planctomycetota bacterium]